MLKRLNTIAITSIFLAGCLTLASTLAVAAEKLRSAQISADPQSTRLVLDLSGKVRFTTQTLSNPDRLVIDLRDTRNAANLKDLTLQETAVQNIRSGIRNGNDLRLVLDLAAPATAKARLDSGNRLVVELRERGPRKTAAVRSEAISNATAASAAVPRPIKGDSEGRRDIVITIDAGHGGHDAGAVGPGRATEKVVTLAIARELAALLERERGYKPVLTRSKDKFIPLKTRAEIARKAQADLFVSIHADAFTSPDARGGSVFALSDRGATSTMAAFLAAEANKSDQIGGVSTAGKDDDLVKVLADLSMTSSMDASMSIGGKILSAMGNIGRLHSRRVEQAGFMVLKSPDTPSILVETGFISNPGEARLLTSRDYQRRMANAIFNGIHGHFSRNPPPNTYLAWVKRNRSSQQALADADESIGRP
ncbi:MAG: N-acetylmuramoyl-L-alanine amidase [Spongiibacteraceae bacterium]